MLKQGLYTLSICDAEQEIISAARRGSKIIRLPSNISDKASFVEGIRAGVPLDPPVMAPNWDALEDSIWEGICSLSEPSVVIVWPNADVMERRSPAEFAVATELLDSITRTLASDKVTVGAPKRVCIILTNSRN